MATSNLIKKKIVVIGYGVSGSRATANLAKGELYDITVVTPFDYQEISLCMTKAIAVGPEEHEKCIYPIMKEDGVTYIHDTVQSIQPKTVVTSGGQAIPFDACIVAVGQKIANFYPDPYTQSTMAARKAFFSGLHSDIRKANSIVISGGGPVGTEAAADIKLRFPEKKVTVVNPTSDVLAMMKDEFRLLATANLEKIGVELVLSARVVKHEDGLVHLVGNRTLPCDVYLPCHATGGNAGSFLPASSVDNKGYAMVNDSFQVTAMDGVFAYGDCTNYTRVKTIPMIDDQTPVLIANIKNYLAGKVLQHHVKGASFMGKLEGPMMVAFGHGMGDEGYGVGPALPGCMGTCCWFCCCCGPPCSTPAGPGVAKAKSDFNYTITPKKGKGIA